MSNSDRLSSLPDELLHHILSFLRSTHSLAHLSFLSRRFRLLWTHHPSLHLFMHLPILRLSSTYVQNYIRNVDLCLTSCNSSALETLFTDLWFSNTDIDESPAADDIDLAARWLRFVQTRPVNALHVLARSRSPMGSKIPAFIFSPCYSVTELTLTFCTLTDFPSNFPEFQILASLSVGRSYVDDETLSSLLFKCPALESLVVFCCLELTHIEVSARNLKHLHLSQCCRLTRVSVEAPCLVSLETNTPDIDLNGSLPCLVETKILVNPGGCFWKGKQWTTLVSKFCNVRKISVGNWFFEFNNACRIAEAKIRRMQLRASSGLPGLYFAISPLSTAKNASFQNYIQLSEKFSKIFKTDLHQEPILIFNRGN